MFDILVQYNGNTIYPTPLVQQNYRFLDCGQRWGNVLEIELQGYVTGLTSTGSITGLINIFTGQFGTLNVYQTSESSQQQIYSWNNLNIESIEFPNNSYLVNSFVPYHIKMHQYNVPSGVLDPVNEYSFNQGEDGTVTLTHKMGARGVKNNIDAFDNAIAFIKSISGRNAFQTAFIPSGVGALMSLSENINRAEGAYYLTETYKYTTGINQPYCTWFNASVTNSLDNEYLLVNSELKIQGSPVQNNLSQIEAQIPAGLDSSLSLLNQMGINTGLLLTNSMSVVRDSGSATITIKRDFISGYYASDFNGFFDYVISIDEDWVLPKETWKVEGEFICKGPLDYKKQQLAVFKNTMRNVPNYLMGLISGSEIFSEWHNDNNLPSSLYELSVKENTGIATWQASLTMYDGTYPSGIVMPKYAVDVSPSKWAFDLLPSANIEGHYVVQDLQMATQAHLSFNVSCDSDVPWIAAPLISGYLVQLEEIYINSGAITSQTLSTGLVSASNTREWIGTDNLSTGILNTKVVGSYVSNYLRQPGYSFGY
jgi:hypothetical protein